MVAPAAPESVEPLAEAPAAASMPPTVRDTTYDTSPPVPPDELVALAAPVASSVPVPPVAVGAPVDPEPGKAPVLAPRAGAPGSAPQRTIPEAPLSSALRPIESAPAPAAIAPPKASAKAGKLAAGALIDKKYAVLRVLGEGGMGVVYLARDIHTGLDVVVKAVRSELAHRADVRARTLAEGRALAQIDHPNVVHLRAVAVDGANLYLVMQYIDGDSLDKIIGARVASGQPMALDEALAIFRQIVSGVGAAHDEGVIHRDLKPANVIVRRKDRVAKVTDFGIALVPSDLSRPLTRGVVGSLWYMSPEQVVGRRDLDPRVDIYALGVMLYQMLVGRVPFDADSDYEIMKLHAEAPMPFAAAVRADLPPAVDELLQRACAKDREQRFQSAVELLTAVDRLAASAAPAVPAPPGLTPPIPLVRRELDGGPDRSGEGALLPAASGERASASGSLEREALASQRIEPDGRAGSVARPAKKRRWLAALLSLVVLGLLGGGAAVAFGLVPGIPGVPALTALLGHAPPRHVNTPPPPPPASSPVVDASVPKTMLDALAGSWVGHGRELEAVVTGSDLEFRVKKPDQFPLQGYEAGEARFVLHATREPNVFTVEDRLRPAPPNGKTYDPKARASCEETWTSVGGDPLRARLDATKLAVEFARVEPTPANFTVEGNRVTGCVGLRDAKVTKMKNTLSRASAQ